MLILVRVFCKYAQLLNYFVITDDFIIHIIVMHVYMYILYKAMTWLRK